MGSGVSSRLAIQYVVVVECREGEVTTVKLGMAGKVWLGVHCGVVVDS